MSSKFLNKRCEASLRSINGWARRASPSIHEAVGNGVADGLGVAGKAELFQDAHAIGAYGARTQRHYLNKESDAQELNTAIRRVRSMNDVRQEPEPSSTQFSYRWNLAIIAR